MMNTHKNTLYAAFGILCALQLVACSKDSNPVGPNTKSDVVILVDNTDPNGIQAPCGTGGTVCKNILEGLIAAQDVTDGIPTVLVRPGVYEESVPPALYYENPRMLVSTPVYLKSENPAGARIQNVDVFITVPHVTIEGLHFNFAPIAVKDGGSASLRNCRLENTPANRMSLLEAEGTGSSLRVENSEIYGNIDSYSNTHIEVINSKISSAYESVAIWSEGNLMNNEIYGDVSLVGMPTTSKATVQNNIIHGELRVVGGIAEISGNTIYGNSDPESGGVNVSSVRDVDIRLRNNTIWGNAFALYLYDVPRAFLSQNRFNSKKSGIAIVQCEDSVNIESDGTNTLLQTGFRIDCKDLPENPGTGTF